MAQLDARAAQDSSDESVLARALMRAQARAPRGTGTLGAHLSRLILSPGADPKREGHTEDCNDDQLRRLVFEVLQQAESKTQGPPAVPHDVLSPQVNAGFLLPANTFTSIDTAATPETAIRPILPPSAVSASSKRHSTKNKISSPEPEAVQEQTFQVLHPPLGVRCEPYPSGCDLAWVHRGAAGGPRAPELCEKPRSQPVAAETGYFAVDTSSSSRPSSLFCDRQAAFPAESLSGTRMTQSDVRSGEIAREAERFRRIAQAYTDNGTQVF